MAALPAPTSVSDAYSVINSGDKYRGAVVEDLQLPPAFSLPSSKPISRALELAYDRDFSHLPVLDSHRKPVGYVDVTKLKTAWEAGKADPNDQIVNFTTKFRRTAHTPYTLITPLTSLVDLEVFLKGNVFALVTDSERKFVLAIATQDDLNNFVSRRGF